ncbi:MAG: glutamine--fructose-6-phosphate transaminase (isomerizing) [Candidatus Micrarchaeota archaeon]|nr:glutamine--fructose-6-phosphate transaminase (isomerizing) [Candidatus Micrarchaeota archaeon]
MCGIIGYIGHRKASEVILAGLRRLEYRGYDSAGIATLDGKIRVIKDVGKIDEIHKKKNFLQLEGNMGIGHTRWATHGGVTPQNAHPHSDCSGKIFVIHNGVIENFEKLKEELLSAGHRFTSETDTELVAHLIEDARKKEKDFGKAFEKAVGRLTGSWSLVVMAEGEQAIYLSRNGPPLVMGVGKGEMICASDVAALLEYTNQAIFLEDGDRAEMHKDGFVVFGKDGKKVARKVHAINWTAQMAQKDGYPHFMIKEINEQQSKVREALAADVSEAVGLLKNQSSIAVVASGSSYHAGLVFKLAMHRLLGASCEVAYASEYPYLRTGKEKVVVAISQSGETADTLAAVRLAKKDKAKIIAITNVVGSSLYREADARVVIGAGPELSVVATKSFTCQLAVLTKIAISLAGKSALAGELAALSWEIERLASRSNEIKKIASALAKRRDFFFIGRSYSYPVALEGALKLKEITYLHAEAYAAGELKHGPLSLLDKEVVVVALAPSDESLPKTASNIQECKARNATLLVLSDSEELLSKSALSFRMPPCSQLASPILYSIPLQMLAYYMAVELGRDPDKPRNLAKSVTVE